jgi:hypothetical protein
MLRRVVRWPPLVNALDRCDRALLSCWPGLQRWCRYVVITLRRSYNDRASVDRTTGMTDNG